MSIKVPLSAEYKASIEYYRVKHQDAHKENEAIARGELKGSERAVESISSFAYQRHDATDVCV